MLRAKISIEDKQSEGVLKFEAVGYNKAYDEALVLYFRLYNTPIYKAA